MKKSQKTMTNMTTEEIINEIIKHMLSTIKDGVSQ